MNNKVKIAWYGKHFGEEPPLVGENHPQPLLEKEGRRGAGTIFFSGCNLKCVFCQNWQISHKSIGRDYSVSELVDIMLDLQKQDAANINLVTPTPWRRQIKEALIIAKKNGLKIPIVWNSNAYENVSGLKEIKGLVDVYLPDFKYGDDEAAIKYSRAPEYFKIADKAIREMYHQVGLLEVDENGLAKKGLIIRHLILPNNINNTFKVLEKISLIDKNIHLSLMSQYNPVYYAKNFSEINQKIKKEEIEKAEEYKWELGLKNGWVQEPDSEEIFLPDFNKKNPFNI